MSCSTHEDWMREQEVLNEAVDTLGDWITRLPACSAWRRGFLVIRREVAAVASRPAGPRRVPAHEVSRPSASSNPQEVTA